MLALIVVTSGIVNKSSITDILIFFRYIIIPYAMYYLVSLYINHNNVIKVIKYSIILAMLQLPVVIIQRLFYDQLIPFSAVPISATDFMFGTFLVKDDPALSMFLIGVILFLLLDRRNNYFIKRKHFIAAWLTITVLLSNAIITHFILIGIWGYYLLIRLSAKTILHVGVAGLIVMSVFFYSGYLQDWIRTLQGVSSPELLYMEGSEEKFLEGGYARGAAVLYYLNQPLKLLGDGPTKYYSPATGEFLLGNKGQLFVFYSEIGLFGLLVSYWIFFRMARYKIGSSPEIARPYFLAIVILTVTTQAINSLGVIFAYNIFLSTNLVSGREVPSKLSRT